jgi:dimeric dUTPase (all-alpha-NTP-PPase superfamily)
MNIKDYKSGVTEKDLPNALQLIFARQEELSKKYVEIESSNHLRWTTDIPLDVNDPKGQAQLKDYAWRVIEEIGESIEASEDKLHMKEELADGLHFITELLILVGISHSELQLNFPEDFYAKGGDQDFLITEFVMRLGVSMNNLKCKPWKNSHYETDKKKLKEDLLLSFHTYISLCLNTMEPLELLDLYFRKSQVNQFRIRSNY